MRWSPYAQHYKEDNGDRYKYYGYGNYGGTGYGRLRCQDRVTISCENEYFVSVSVWNIQLLLDSSGLKTVVTRKIVVNRIHVTLFFCYLLLFIIVVAENTA